ncbi:hypothetical protein GCM10010246_59030 [Streptomyces cuspidosporus]|uniref:FAD/NAD(P)-binding domain-containing protein n=1 Tax=Streptomyces cuspidosporus TaxID=66882 RepID=A0ABN3GUN2_9ACTN
MSIALESGDTLECDVLLVAVGRGPNTAGHGYEESGLKLERGFVATDERLRTNPPDVYAVGDIVAGPQLAHRGFRYQDPHVRPRGPDPVRGPGRGAPRPCRHATPHARLTG